jgi:hypothetical protein
MEKTKLQQYHQHQLTTQEDDEMNNANTTHRNNHIALFAIPAILLLLLLSLFSFLFSLSVTTTMAQPQTPGAATTPPPGPQPPQCPPGYTLNSATDLCERTETTPPQCPPGYTFNPATDQCEQTPTPTPTPANNTGGADTTAPVLTVPDNIVALDDRTIDFPDGNVVSFTVTARDDVDGVVELQEDGRTMRQDNVTGDITLFCLPASQSFFTIAVTTVECTAIDEAGNRGTASFTVTVRGSNSQALTDTTPTTPPPTMPPGNNNTTNTAGGLLSVMPNNTNTTGPDTTPPVFVLFSPSEEERSEQEIASGEVLCYVVIVGDNVDGEATLLCNNVLYQDNIAGDITIACNPPGSILYLEDTTIVCSATDAAGNVGTASFTVIVTPPPPTGFERPESGLGGLGGLPPPQLPSLVEEGEQQQPPPPTAATEEEQQTPGAPAEEGDEGGTPPGPGVNNTG